MRAMVYARVASALPDDQIIGLDRQIDRCYRFVDEQGWDVASVFTDLGESGDDPKRSGLDELLESLSAGDLVVVSDHARIARNPLDYSTIRERIESTGAVLCIAAGGSS